MKYLQEIIYCIIFLFACLLTLSCNTPEHNPKPRMYPKINFPEYKYQNFSTTYCPFTFQFPDYWEIIKDTSFFGEKPVHECWFNMEMKTLYGTIHCSYYNITTKKELRKYLKDAYKMAREHQIKANYIDEIPIVKPNHISGMLYNIEGPTASPFQFYLTDSLHHFFRGSLYFNAQTRPDSLKPITEFVKSDIMVMLNSFEWK